MQIKTYLSDDPKENLVLGAFNTGCNGELTHFEDYQPSDVAVVMGVHKRAVPRSFPRGKVIEEQKKRGLDVIILETGYINRGDEPDNHYAAGWNGLNGRADFKNKACPADRAKKLVSLKDWNPGSNIVVCGQVPWDAAVEHTDHREWLQKIVRAIFMVTDRPVIFRPHPKAKLPPIEGTIYSTRPLAQDLEDAYCCVTFNSNSGVEAVIAGVPTITMDKGAMAWEVTSHSLSDMQYMPDRQQWLNNLCYSQWTPEEMRNGEAWRHLAST